MSISHSISKLTAENIKSGEVKKKYLQKEANDILFTINNELKNAQIQGTNEIAVNLPTIFTISGLTNSDSQREIYYRILVDLEDRGFIPEIEFNGDDNVRLHVSWLSEIEKEQIQLQLEYIRQHTRK